MLPRLDWSSSSIIVAGLVTLSSFLHSSPNSLIPTPSHFYKRANTLATKLLDTCQCKTHLLESKHYNSILRWVLKELHELVGQPVVNKPRELGIPGSHGFDGVRRPFLLPSSPCHGANSIKQESKAVLLRPICVFIVTID